MKAICADDISTSARESDLAECPIVRLAVAAGSAAMPNARRGVPRVVELGVAPPPRARAAAGALGLRGKPWIVVASEGRSGAVDSVKVYAGAAKAAFLVGFWRIADGRAVAQMLPRGRCTPDRADAWRTLEAWAESVVGSASVPEVL